ncbi:SRPBCC domain-containing protein [Aquimarina sp. U1-2]|uniref:SRPBCC domain-containing protein n=1 Tax=Aquimarina sp. U1-2 TaxID=2823141 RepID=UPI001AECAED6|nr:SRPBCC domain-containing protein [Aquimarina sp. U1-2]MBP2830792.1 SRPBCC domain-containing protein [Aquimarina sp. U1-2]
MEIKTEIKIKATSQKVWQILMDFDNYPQWNPFIKKIHGEPKIGHTIKIVLPEMTFTPVVTSLKMNNEFKWLGSFLYKGLFAGEHRFKIEDHGNGTLTFLHSEKFSGILVPIFKRKLLTSTKQGFEAMNKKIKEIAEK